MCVVNARCNEKCVDCESKTKHCGSQVVIVDHHLVCNFHTCSGYLVGWLVEAIDRTVCPMFPSQSRTVAILLLLLHSLFCLSLHVCTFFKVTMGSCKKKIMTGSLNRTGLATRDTLHQEGRLEWSKNGPATLLSLRSFSLFQTLQ